MWFNLPSVDANVLAAIAAAGGAITIKLIEKWAIRRSENLIDAQKIRDELRSEITRLRDENIRLHTESLSWHNKYWEIKELQDSGETLIDSLKADRDIHVERIKVLESQLHQDRKDIDELEDDVDELRQTFNKLSSKEPPTS
jgi:chromosome segregation ATPase